MATYKVGDNYYNDQYKSVGKPTSGMITEVPLSFEGIKGGSVQATVDSASQASGLSRDVIQNLLKASGQSLRDISSKDLSNEILSNDKSYITPGTDQYKSINKTDTSGNGQTNSNGQVLGASTTSASSAVLSAGASSANTLYDFYKAQGQTLPSVTERAPLYAKYGGTGTYTGSADQNNFLLKQLKANGIPVTSAPNNANGVSTGTGSNLPTNVPQGTGSIAGATASTAGIQSELDTAAQQRADQIKMEKDALAKTTSGQGESTFLQKLLGQQNPADARAAAEKAAGIDPATYFADQKAKIAEIGSLTEKYNAIKASVDAAIAKSYDALASNSFINNQIGQIQRNAAPQLNELSANINAKTAVLNALQGNFHEAMNFVNQAVQDVTAEEKYNLDMYTAYKSINNDAFDALDAPYKTAYDAKVAEMKKAYEQSVNDATEVGKLMLSNPKAGILMTDSLATAYSKAAANPTATASQTEVVEVNGRKVLINSQTGATIKDLGSTPKGSGGSGETDGGYKFTATQLNKGSATAGVDISNFKTLSGDVQNFFISNANQAKIFQQSLADVKSGSSNASTEKQAINDSSLPDSVKVYLNSQIDAVTPAEKKSWWQGVSDWAKNLKSAF